MADLSVAVPTPGASSGQQRVISARRYELDWLRVLATALVFLFHSARFFDLEDWHVKSAETSFLFQVYIGSLSQVIMPAFFVLSGIATTYALAVPLGRHIRERAKRLLVPLIFGILFLAPPQVYLDRLTHGLYRGSFLEWLPSYFDLGAAGPGPRNFAWSGVHLWYLLVLLEFSLLTVPLFLWLRSAGGRRLVDGLVGLLNRPGMIYLPALPLFLVLALDHFLDVPENGGWGMLTYLALFVSGYLFLGDERLRPTIARLRRRSLALAIVLLPTTLGLWSAFEALQGALPITILLGLARAFHVWTWLLAGLGFASVHLTRTSPRLRYANEAVLPFYILHQPVILLVGYLVVLPLPLPLLAKYVLVLALALPTVLGLYELVVRRVGLLRFLFGLKPAASKRS